MLGRFRNDVGNRQIKVFVVNASECCFRIWVLGAWGGLMLFASVVVVVCVFVIFFGRGQGVMWNVLK